MKLNELFESKMSEFSMIADNIAKHLKKTMLDDDRTESSKVQAAIRDELHSMKYKDVPADAKKIITDRVLELMNI